MTEILLRGADCVVTMDGTRREIAGGDVLIRSGVIAAVGVGLTTIGRMVEAREIGRGQRGGIRRHARRLGCGAAQHRADARMRRRAARTRACGTRPSAGSS